MPKQKDLKRLVRSRMEKTHESYTAARAQLIRKKAASSASPASPSTPSTAVSPTARNSVRATAPTSAPTSDVVKAAASSLATTAGMSDEAVRAKTGKSWAQWVRTLDAVDAGNLSHRDIAAHLREVHKVEPWWTQMVTVGYERIKGRRERGQRCDGQYECTKSRTFAVPVEALYRAFASAPVRRKWLGDIELKVRKATPPKSVRITWPDATSVEVGLVAKGEKSQAAIQHSKLPSREEATRLKAWWNDRLDMLAQVLRD